MGKSRNSPLSKTLNAVTYDLRQSSLIDSTEAYNSVVNFFNEKNGNKEWFDSLSDNDKQLLHDYTFDDNLYINGMLRGTYQPDDVSRAKYEKELNTIQNAITKNSAKVDFVTYRTDDGGLLGLSSIKDLSSLTIGSVFETRGFLSTTVGDTCGVNGSFRYKIKVNKGSKVGEFIGKVSAFPGETEFLIKNACKLKLIGIDKNTNEIQLECIR